LRKADHPDVDGGGPGGPRPSAEGRGPLRGRTAHRRGPIGKATVVEIPPRRAPLPACAAWHFETDKDLPDAQRVWAGIRQLVKVYKSFEGIVGLVKRGTPTSRAPARLQPRALRRGAPKMISKGSWLDDVDSWGVVVRQASSSGRAGASAKIRRC